MSMIEAERGEWSVISVEQEDPEAAEERVREALSGYVGELQREVDRRIGLKRQLEERWLRDLRQYHGVYESGLLADLARQNRSELFLNVTRSKTNTAAAKLSDMLFPTDDRNWAIEPTPVPDVVRRLEEIDEMGAATEQRANELLDAGQEEAAQALISEAQPLLDEAGRSRKAIKRAQRAAEGMQDHIADELEECEYNEQSRKVIEDACKLGAGVVKGPVKLMKPDREWKMQTGPDGVPFIQLVDRAPRMRGAAYWVDAWHFFPDPDVANHREGDGTYERHLYKDKDLRRLSRLPGFDQNAIRRLLKRKPTGGSPYFMAELRTMTGSHQDTASDTYHVFEHYGTITAKQLIDIAMALGKTAMAMDYEDADPLAEIHVAVWFCDGEVLKFGEQALDTNECLYDMFCWQKEEGTPWGYGVPYTMRDIQASICAFWRAILDNAGLSTVPQIVIDQTGIEPENGSWDLEGGKIWLKTRVTAQGERLFETFDLPARLGDLLAMVNAALSFVDEETGISQLAEGQQNSGVTKTAQGMSILMNSTNVVFRRVVKAFDDNLTKPLIKRFYDWNMQWNPDHSIKGDMQVRARGSSVLLVQEIQAQNMAGLFQLALADPAVRDMTRLPEAYRYVVAAGKVPQANWVLSDDEIAEKQQQRAQQPPAPDPEMMKLEVQERIATMEMQTKLQIAQYERDTRMMELAQSSNVKLDEIEAMLERQNMTNAHKERMRASEMAMVEATGRSAGGAV